MKRTLWMFLFLLLPLVAHAKIYILIEEASTRKFPIAVPEFLTLNGKQSAFTRSLTDLVRRDLQIAGFFKVLDESSFLGHDFDVEAIDFSKWTALEAYALLKGVVQNRGDGHVLIEMHLYDTQTQKLLVGKQYTVKKKQYFLAVHRFMDEVLLALTGTKGPFSSRIVAACGKSNARQIYTMSIDGVVSSLVSKIKSNNISPNWSPDGKSIAFTSFVRYYPEIYLTHADGSGIRQLTKFGSTTITPAFSPDGKDIAFASSRSGDTELYVMNRSGRIMSRLTQVLNIDVSPSWSPDGSQIVFASERAGNLHLFVTGAGGGGTTRLTYTGYQNDQPDWSPDGKKIVFTARDRGAFDIFTINPDGSFIQRLTRDEGNNESPTWSPDGRYIAFSSGRGGARGVYVMLDDGNNQTLIPNTAGCINPDWGPRIR